MTPPSTEGVSHLLSTSPGHGHYLPDRLTLCQSVECFVQFLERNNFAQQLVDREFAPLVEGNVARYIPCRNTGTKIASFEGTFFSSQLNSWNRESMLRIWKAGSDRRASTFSNFGG